MAIANVVELKQVVSQRETAPLWDVAKAINIKLRLADQNENDARQHRVEAGEMLVTLRQRVEADDQEWWKFAKDHFDRERKELEKLMFVAANDVAKTAIKANPQMSDRVIAAEVGVGKDTVRRARDTVGANAPTEKRTGKDGKQYKASKARQQAKTTQAKQPEPAPEPRKLPKPPKIDADVIKQATTFINELMNCQDLFARIKAWHAANTDAIELADRIHAGQIHFGVVHALEATSVAMQLTAQEIDGR